MSRSTVHQQLFINDGLGNMLPIQTGTFVTQAINIEEQRRVSLTIGVQSATGYGLGTGTAGGFTGILVLQGTDEIASCTGQTGTPAAGASSQPGTNGFTGALFWNALPSGTVAINNAMPSNGQLISLTDVGTKWVRVAFNVSATGSTATGTLGGSGTMQLFLTAKNT